MTTFNPVIGDLLETDDDVGMIVQLDNRSETFYMQWKNKHKPGATGEKFNFTDYRVLEKTENKGKSLWKVQLVGS